ncbi:MAG: hypothetical protein ACRCST_13495 [Turicibacter sp.]
MKNEEFQTLSDTLGFESSQQRRSVGKINTQTEYDKFLVGCQLSKLVIQPKLDGVNLLLIWNSGVVRATTRGGMDVTEKISKIEVVGIPKNFNGYVMGELVHYDGRTKATGFLNRKKWAKPTDFEIDIGFMRVYAFQLYDIQKQLWYATDHLSTPCESPVLGSYTVVKVYDEFPCDGIVIKQYDNANIAVAYKGVKFLFYSVCLDIQLVTGEKGRLTPILTIEPVELPNGNIISSLSCYSQKILWDFNIKKFDRIAFKTESNYDFPVLVGLASKY